MALNCGPNEKVQLSLFIKGLVFCVVEKAFWMQETNQGRSNKNESCQRFTLKEVKKKKKV